MNATSGRITRPYSENLLRAISSAYKYIDTLILYEHSVETGTVKEGGKTHVHFCFTHCCDLKTIKNLINSNMVGDKLSGNEDWKFKKWDNDVRAIAYMTKGKLIPKMSKGYSSDDPERFKAMWVEKSPVQKEPSKTIKLYLELIDGSHKSGHRLSRVFDLPQMVDASYPRFSAVLRYFTEELYKVYRLPTPSFFRDRRTYTLAFCYDNGIETPRQKNVWENLD